MVATSRAEHLTSRSRRWLFEYDIDDAANLATIDVANSAKCVPIAEFRRFLAMVMTSVGTGGSTVFSITAATSAAGAGAVAVVTHAHGSNPNAVGDFLVLECDAEQIREVLPTATHVGVTLDLVTTTDEAVGLFEAADPLYARAGLTADYVA